MRALLLCAAIAQALQFTTQQAKTPALLDAATILKASARPLTKVLLDAAEGDRTANLLTNPSMARAADGTYRGWEMQDVATAVDSGRLPWKRAVAPPDAATHPHAAHALSLSRG